MIKYFERVMIGVFFKGVKLPDGQRLLEKEHAHIYPVNRVQGVMFTSEWGGGIGSDTLELGK